MYAENRRYYQAEVVTPRQLARAILELLSTAQERGAFTSKTYPVWDGWTTAKQVAMRVDERIMNRLFSEADPEEYFGETYLFVEPVMQAMTSGGLLERKVVYPYMFHRETRLRGEADWAFRQKGATGYCLWFGDWPVGDPSDEELDELDAMSCGERRADVLRQVRERLLPHPQYRKLRDELAVMDSEVPPYEVARMEQYLGNKSGLRSMR